MVKNLGKLSDLLEMGWIRPPARVPVLWLPANHSPLFHSSHRCQSPETGLEAMTLLVPSAFDQHARGKNRLGSSVARVTRGLFSGDQVKRLTAATSLPAALMRAMASRVFSIAVAM